MPSWGIPAELPCLASGRLRVQPELGSLLLSSFSGVSPGKEKGGKKEKILKSWLSWGRALCLPCEHVSLSSTRDVNFSKQKKEGRGNQLLSTPGTPSPPERGDVPWLGTVLPPRAPSPQPPRGQSAAAEGPPCHGAVTPLHPASPGRRPAQGDRGPRFGFYKTSATPAAVTAWCSLTAARFKGSVTPHPCHRRQTLRQK